MDEREVNQFASRRSFYDIYTGAMPGADILVRYFDYCRTVDPKDPAAAHHIVNLELFERAERLDFDSWLETARTREFLAQYAGMYARCDIFDKYIERMPEISWNFYVSAHYHPSMYHLLHRVMPMPVSLDDARSYAKHGLYREVFTHIVGRRDRHTGETITLKRIVACRQNSAMYEGLAEVGLDLSDPELLYNALMGDPVDAAIVRLLREHCKRLDELMPNGKTLRQMLAE